MLSHFKAQNINPIRTMLKALVVLCYSLTAPSVLAVDEALEARITAMVDGMSVEQKVGQMVQGEIKWVTPADVTKYHLGSVLNGGGSFPDGNKLATMKDWLDLADSYYKASLDRSKGGAGIPIIWGTDAVHGHNNVIGATLFPHNIGLGAARDPELLRQIGEVTAREVAVTGIDWIFAPTVAVVQDLRWGRAYEGYTSDAQLVKAYAEQIVLGMQGNLDELRTDDEKVVATAKHFIGDGGTYRGIDQGDTRLSLEHLIQQHGQGYLSAIDAGVQTVMASFNSWNGDKIHGNKTLLTEVLKGSMGFDGFVIGDWNGHGQVSGCTNESCARSINAGVDMIMVPEDWKELLLNTIQDVKTGKIAMSRIDDAVTRILRVKIRGGLFDKGLPSSREVAGKQELIGAQAHRAIARDAVRKSLVLLKNRNDLLPLKPAQHVLVTGDAADNIGKQNGGWTITWQGTENTNSNFPGATSIYGGIASAMNDIGGSTELSADGKWAKKPDVAVVVFGEDPYAEGVGDIDSLAYKFGSNKDLRLLEKLRDQGIPVVSIFLTGRPLAVNAELNASDAFVVAWLPGTEGQGISDVIVADKQGQPRFDFTGRLPFDWPNLELNADDKHLPVADNILKSGDGLSFGDAEIIAEQLDKGVVASGVSARLVVFNRTSRAPFNAFVGDKSDWARPLDGKVTKSAHGNLRVSAVDGELQEDSLRAIWSGRRESQFFWQSEEALNLKKISDLNGAVMVEFMVNKRPKGKVIQRFDCGWPCSASQDVTKMFKTVPMNEWVTRGISLKCFAAAGADVERAMVPFLLTTSRPFDITIKNVRIVPKAPVDLIEYCQL